jgi:hypothetical protein
LLLHLQAGISHQSLLADQLELQAQEGFLRFEESLEYTQRLDICFLTAVKDFNEYKVVHRDITDEIAKNDDSCIIDKPFFIVPITGSLTYDKYLL